MKKIFTSTVLGLLVLPAVAEVSGPGVCTANIVSEYGDVVSYEVFATLNGNTLKVDNFGNTGYPITFNVDLTTGVATASGKQICHIEEYRDTEGEVYDSRAFYYATINPKDYGVKAKFFNFSDTQCALEAEPWNFLTELFPGYYVGMDKSDHFKTQIIFDFHVPNLVSGALTEYDREEAEPPMLTAVDGLWEFNFRSFGDGEGPSTRTEQFRATSEGNVITFKWIQSQPSSMRCGNMVGSYNAETQTMVFSGRAVNGGSYNNLTYNVYAILYDPIEEIVEPTNLEVKYDVNAHTLTFPTSSGFMWEVYKDNDFYGINDIFVVRSAQQLTGLFEDPGYENGIETVGTDAAPIRYFNLQGREITNPEIGTIVIKIENNKSSKVLIK